MSPLHALAQSNPWIVSPQTAQRSGGPPLPGRGLANDQYGNGYDTAPWGIRPNNQAAWQDNRARQPARDFNSRQPPRYERRPVYGPLASERWTGTPPQSRVRANQYGSTARRQAGPGQYTWQEFETGALSRYARQGRLIPNFAVGQFGPAQPRPSGEFMQYPPAGYDPSRTRRLVAPRQRQRWQPPRQPRPYNYSWSAQSARGQPARRAWPPPRNAWPYGAGTPNRPSWSSNPTWSATPPWAVNPGQNGPSQGFAGPSTFTNPFGSPFGGLSGPFGGSNGLGMPPAGMW